MNRSRFQPRFPQHRQRGAVLLVALIFLILLTLLAIGASSGSLLQQRMVAATRNAQLAQMSADTALRGAEWYLWTNATRHEPILCGISSINTTTGCIKYDPTQTPYLAGGAVLQFRTANNTWLSGTGITYKGVGSLDFTTGHDTADLAQNPQYIIEDMGSVSCPGCGIQHESGVSGTRTSVPGQNIDIHAYRITARATGGNKNTVRVVQSVFDAQTN